MIITISFVLMRKRQYFIMILYEKNKYREDLGNCPKLFLFLQIIVAIQITFFLQTYFVETMNSEAPY